MQRTVETNQRIYFDLDPSGHYLISGTANFPPNRVQKTRWFTILRGDASSLFHRVPREVGGPRIFNNHAVYLHVSALFHFDNHVFFLPPFLTTHTQETRVAAWQFGTHKSEWKRAIAKVLCCPWNRCRKGFVAEWTTTVRTVSGESLFASFSHGKADIFCLMQH